MEDETLGYERVWIQQKLRSINQTINWLDEISKFLSKYNFNDMYPIIVSLLRRSNSDLWNPIDIATLESREYDIPINNINIYLEELYDKLEEEKNKSEKNEELINFLSDDISYIKNNYNSEKKTLKRIKELNYNYTDLDLLDFFYNYAEKLEKLIKNISLENPDEMFKIYFANLFAHKINGCFINIEDNQIKIEQNKIEYESQ